MDYGTVSRERNPLSACNTSETGDKGQLCVSLVFEWIYNYVKVRNTLETPVLDIKVQT